tara:strand:- start:170 stop:565 length:396 start_codon:yes stop_codon:yes gene_type:complete
MKTEIQKIHQSLLSLDTEKLWLLLSDYIALQKIKSDYVKKIKPLEEKIKKLNEEIFQKRKSATAYKRGYMLRHLKKLDLPKHNLYKFVDDDFTVLEQAIKELALKSNSGLISVVQKEALLEQINNSGENRK